MKLSWISISAIAWSAFAAVAAILAMFLPEIQFVRIILNDSQGVFFAIPLVIILAIALTIVLVKSKGVPLEERFSWNLYSIATYIMTATVAFYVVMLFIPMSMGSDRGFEAVIEMLVRLLPVLFVGLAIIGIIVEITKPSWKGRPSVWWLPLALTLLFWLSTWLLNNDGLWYNDPPIMAIPTLAFLLPAMLCSIAIQRAAKDRISLVYKLIGSGFFVMFFFSVFFLLTRSFIKYNDFTLLTIGLMAMLTLIIVGVDRQQSTLTITQQQ